MTTDTPQRPGADDGRDEFLARAADHARRDPVTTKARRRRAARLYAAGTLATDDSELAGPIADELRKIADGILRRAKWTGAGWPGADDVLAALQGKDGP